MADVVLREATFVRESRLMNKILIIETTWRRGGVVGGEAPIVKGKTNTTKFLPSSR